MVQLYKIHLAVSMISLVMASCDMINWIIPTMFVGSFCVVFPTLSMAIVVRHLAHEDLNDILKRISIDYNIEIKELTGKYKMTF